MRRMKEGNYAKLRIHAQNSTSQEPEVRTRDNVSVLT